METQEQINKFYVYVYLDPRKPGSCTYGSYSFDYEPFYVGKGNGHRYKRHLEDFVLENDNNKLKTNKINKIIRETNNKPIIIKYKENLIENDAVNLEIDMIATIGRIDLKTGCLVNLTAGGEGMSGYKMKDSTKQLIREKHLGMKVSIETKEKMSKGTKKRWIEHGQEMREHWKDCVEKIWTEERRKEYSEKSKDEKNPNWNNRWSDKQKKHLSVIQKKKGKWLGDNNPSRKNPPRGNKNSNNIYIYTLFDKDSNKLIVSYSVKDIAEKYNVPFLGLKSSCIRGGIYKGLYRITRIKYKDENGNIITNINTSI